MSATLSGGETDNNNNDDDQHNKNNDNSFNKLLNAMDREKECNIVHSEGRQYPIDIQYYNRRSSNTNQ